MLNSFTELLLTDNRTNSFIFESDINKAKPFTQEQFEIARAAEPGIYYLLYQLFHFAIILHLVNIKQILCSSFFS